MVVAVVWKDDSLIRRRNNDRKKEKVWIFHDRAFADCLGDRMVEDYKRRNRKREGKNGTERQDKARLMGEVASA